MTPAKTAGPDALRSNASRGIMAALNIAKTVIYRLKIITQYPECIFINLKQSTTQIYINCLVH